MRKPLDQETRPYIREVEFGVAVQFGVSASEIYVLDRSVAAGGEEEFMMKHT